MKNISFIKNSINSYKNNFIDNIFLLNSKLRNNYHNIKELTYFKNIKKDKILDKNYLFSKHIHIFNKNNELRKKNKILINLCDENNICLGSSISDLNIYKNINFICINNSINIDNNIVFNSIMKFENNLPNWLIEHNITFDNFLYITKFNYKNNHDIFNFYDFKNININDIEKNNIIKLLNLQYLFNTKNIHLSIDINSIDINSMNLLLNNNYNNYNKINYSYIIEVLKYYKNNIISIDLNELKNNNFSEKTLNDEYLIYQKIILDISNIFTN